MSTDGPPFNCRPVPLTLHCNRCDADKPASEFYRRTPTLCKDCALRYQRQRQEQRRAEMGDEAWRAHQAAIVARHRARTGGVRDRDYSRAQTAALWALVDLHRSEYDHLLLLARRGELRR